MQYYYNYYDTFMYIMAYLLEIQKLYWRMISRIGAIFQYMPPFIWAIIVLSAIVILLLRIINR